MQVKVIIESAELSKEELKGLIQGIRDCEQKVFPDKQISILIDAPELATSEVEEIFRSIKPPYKYGPYIWQKR